MAPPALGSSLACPSFFLAGSARAEARVFVAQNAWCSRRNVGRCLCGSNKFHAFRGGAECCPPSHPGHAECPPVVKWNVAPVRGSTKCRPPVATWFPLQHGHGMLAPVAAWQHGTSAPPVPTYPRLSWPHPIPLPWQHGMLLLRQHGANVITPPTSCYPRHRSMEC